MTWTSIIENREEEGAMMQGTIFDGVVKLGHLNKTNVLVIKI